MDFFFTWAASTDNLILILIEGAAQRAVSVNTYEVIYGRALGTFTWSVLFLFVGCASRQSIVYRHTLQISLEVKKMEDKFNPETVQGMFATVGLILVIVPVWLGFHYRSLKAAKIGIPISFAIANIVAYTWSPHYIWFFFLEVSLAVIGAFTWLTKNTRRTVKIGNGIIEAESVGIAHLLASIRSPSGTSLEPDLLGAAQAMVAQYQLMTANQQALPAPAGKKK